MTDFLLLEKALSKYEKQHKKLTIRAPSEESPPGKAPIGEEEDTCEHINTINEKGICICVDCGEEIKDMIISDKEWGYYNQEGKSSFDTSRVQMRKTEERTIFKDVESLGFSESIVVKANKIYAQVTKGKIFRGDSRRSIVFACIFHAFKLSGKPQSHDRLIGIFNLDKKIGLKGLKYVNLYAPKDSKIRTAYITPVNLVEEILEQFSVSKEQKKEVLDLYELIRNRSSKLNRSRPLSVGAGLVFYWTKIKNKGITLKEFAQKVMLSEMTINKVAKEIAEVMEGIKKSPKCKVF